MRQLPKDAGRAVCAGHIAAAFACAAWSGPLWANGADAILALKDGDCRRAGDEINEGLAHEEAGAYFAAGYRYDDTGGVDPDPARAVKYYRRAVELGDSEAQNFLGLMYGMGRGVPQDDVLAGEWFMEKKGTASPANADPARLRAFGYAMTVNQLARSRVKFPRASSDAELIVLVSGSDVQAEGGWRIDRSTFGTLRDRDRRCLRRFLSRGAPTGSSNRRQGRVRGSVVLQVLIIDD